jgi:carboxylesterase
MFSSKPLYRLEPFVNLADVDDFELTDLDFKKAENEGVLLSDNYPKFTKGNDIGVLVVHGFTGSPLEMQPAVDFLTVEGFSIYQVRIAGHGSKAENLNLTTYKDWYESARYGYFLLKRNCRKVFIMGESMGGLVALSVAAFNQTDGVIMLAPCIKMRSSLTRLSPFLHRFVKFLPKFEAADFKKNMSHIYYDTWAVTGIYQLLMYTHYIADNMDKMTFPMLGFQFANDAVVSGRATAEFFAEAPSADKTYVEFPDKKMHNHILVSERNVFRDEMFNKISGWLRERG